MTPLLLSASADVRFCSSLPRTSRAAAEAAASCARAAASASRRSSARARSAASVASASAMSRVLAAAAALAFSAPCLASCSLRCASRFCETSTSRSAVATSARALASAILPSQGESARRAASSAAPAAAISPLSDSSIDSSFVSSAPTSASRLAFFASSAGRASSIARVSAAMSSRFLLSLTSFSSIFLARCFMFFKFSRCWMSFFSKSANAAVAAARSARSAASAAACSACCASSVSIASECSSCLPFSCSSLERRASLSAATRFSSARASAPRLCSNSDLAAATWRSLAMNVSASALAPPSASRSFSTSFRRLTCPPLWSLSASSAFAFSSIGSTYWFVPMMSSRYSSRPSSPGFCALGFIIEICSTSPCRMRNRLLFRSTPCVFKSVVTSVKLLVFSSMKYLLVLFLYASREMTKSDPVTL